VYAEKKLKEKQILSEDQNFRLIILAFWGYNALCNEVNDTDILKQRDVFEMSVSLLQYNVPEDQNVQYQRHGCQKFRALRQDI
jgi:hypothetical protein